MVAGTVYADSYASNINMTLHGQTSTYGSNSSHYYPPVWGTPVLNSTYSWGGNNYTVLAPYGKDTSLDSRFPYQWDLYNIDNTGGYYDPGYYEFCAVYPTSTRTWWANASTSSSYGDIAYNCIPILLTDDPVQRTFYLWSGSTGSYSYDYGFYTGGDPAPSTWYLPYLYPVAYDGLCGTNAKAWDPGSTRFDTSAGAFCASYPYASPSVAFPANGGTTAQWTCAGSNGGATATCYAGLKVNGVPNTSPAVTSSYHKPNVDDLCISGIPTEVSGTGPWSWKCLGENGGTDSVTVTSQLKIDGAVSVSVDNQQLSTQPNVNSSSDPNTNGSYDLCDFGTVASFSGSGTTANPWRWTCLSPNTGNSDTGIAYLKTFGVCGDSATTFTDSDSFYNYSSELCNAGTAVALSPSTDLSYPTISNPTKTWKCLGSSSEYDSPTCTAVLSTTITSSDLQCGNAEGDYSAGEDFPREPWDYPYNYCATGTYTSSASTYTYRVRAINKNNQTGADQTGNWSNVVNATPPSQ